LYGLKSRFGGYQTLRTYALDREKEVKKVAEQNAKKVSFFKGVRNEFKKIIWPSTNTTAKNTYVVVSVVLILGVVIAGIDAGFQFLIQNLLLGTV